MLYPFECEPCGVIRTVDAKPFHPPQAVNCACGRAMRRIYGCHIDTSMCRDHDHIPEGKRVKRASSPRSAQAEEARFQRHIQERRRELKDGNRGSFRHTHSVPADLYHGKIRETGDKEYWKDPRNLKKHDSTRVG